MNRLLAVFAWLSLQASATPLDPNCLFEALARTEAILNPRTPFGSKVDVLAAHWVRRAERHVARMQGTVAEKRDLLRLLTQAISKKVKQVNTSTGSELNWQVVEHQAGESTLFIGGVGHFIELRPDGTLHKGEVDMTQVTPETFLSSDWNPSGSAEGLDKKYVSSRRRVR
jgi:hypothetical protein